MSKPDEYHTTCSAQKCAETEAETEAELRTAWQDMLAARKRGLGDEHTDTITVWRGFGRVPVATSASGTPPTAGNHK